MPHQLFDKHRAMLDAAVNAIQNRGYWSAFSESPSPKIYGESAMEDGRRAYETALGKPFDLQQAGQTGWMNTERSPYGPRLDVSYPVCSAQALIDAGLAAMGGWQKIGAAGRTGICLEILERLNKRSFELAHAVMMTTGQGWMMAFQAGAPHAQDRGLEAVAYAWREQIFVPGESVWEKPQAKTRRSFSRSILKSSVAASRWLLAVALSRPGILTPACSPRWPPATRSSLNRTRTRSCPPR
jgi:hypothetical protein